MGGAGIGGGMYAKGGRITISGGVVNARTIGSEEPISDPDNKSAAIGGGYKASSGNILIKGGKVKADGQFVGIGCGKDGENSSNEMLSLTYYNSTMSTMSVYSNNYTGTVKIDIGKSFSDGYGNNFSSELSPKEKEKIANKTIVPGVSSYYLDTDGEMKGPVSCEIIESTTSVLNSTGATNGWYMVNNNTDINNIITITGDVKLILCDNKKLWINEDVILYKGNSLTIYSQSAGENMGTLSVNYFKAPSGAAGDLIINGGDIFIFNEVKLYNGNMTMNGGKFTTKGFLPINVGSLTVNNGELNIEDIIASSAIMIKNESDAVLKISGGKVSAQCLDAETCIVLESENGKSEIILSGGTLEADGKLAISDGDYTFGGVAVFASKEPGAKPKEASDRKFSCTNCSYVKITPCGTDDVPHAIDHKTGKCKYCDTALDTKITLIASPNTGGTLKATVADDTTKYSGILYAEKGDTVKLEATPSANCTLESLTVTKSSGDPIELNDDNSFLMPGEEVTVTATFDEKPATAPTIVGVTGLTGDDALIYGYASGGISVSATAAEGHTISGYQWYSNTSNSNTGGTAITENGTSASYTIPTGKSAGTTEYYYCVVTATRSDDGKTAAATSGVATVTVGKASQTAPAAPVAESVTSTAVALKKTDGYQYSKDGTDWQDSNLFDTLTASTEYTFCQRAAGDNNHHPSPASPGTKITTTQYTLVYDPGEGASGTMAPAGVSDGDAFTFPECAFTKPEGKTFIRWEMTGVDGVFVPAETVGIASNCAVNGIITVTAKWDSATSAVVTGTPAAKDLTYNGTGRELVTAGVANNGEMRYIIGDSSTAAPTTPAADWSATVPVATNADTYYVWYMAKGEKGYSDSEANCVTVEIKKAALTVTAKPKTITYGDAPANDGVTYSGFVNGETENVLGGTLAFDYNYAQYGNAGDYAITPKGLTSDQYQISFAAGTLTVAPKSITGAAVTLNSDHLTYDGTEQSVHVTGITIDALSLTANDYTISGNTGTDAAAYTLTATGKGNYKDTATAD